MARKTLKDFPWLVAEYASHGQVLTEEDIAGLPWICHYPPPKHYDVDYVARQLKDPSVTIVIEHFIEERVEQLLAHYNVPRLNVARVASEYCGAKNGHDRSLRVEVFLKGGEWCLVIEGNIKPVMVVTMYRLKMSEVREHEEAVAELRRSAKTL